MNLLMAMRSVYLQMLPAMPRLRSVQLLLMVANKKIEINSTGNLTLTGKGAPVAAMSKKNIDVGAVNGAVLTISGEKVDDHRHRYRQEE